VAVAPGSGVSTPKAISILFDPFKTILGFVVSLLFELVPLFLHEVRPKTIKSKIEKLRIFMGLNFINQI
jgi:hypothetical protein